MNVYLAKQICRGQGGKGGPKYWEKKVKKKKKDI